MNTRRILTTGLIASALFLAPAFAQGECGKKTVYVSPPPGGYEQLSPEEAQNMKNRISPDNGTLSSKVVRIPEKQEDREEK